MSTLFSWLVLYTSAKAFFIIAFNLWSTFGRNRLGLSHVDDVAGLLLVSSDFVDPDSILLVGSALRIGVRHDLYPRFFKEHVSKRSNIAKALYCTRRLFEVHLEVPSRFFDIDGHTSAGGRISAKRSPDYQRFPGDDSERIVSFVLAVLIHEPCHSLRVCIDVRCGNVSEGTNYLADQGKE